MSEVLTLALVALVVLGVNLMPAFGPPTWAVIVALTITADVPAVPLVAVAAVSAATGRLLLALGARRLRSRLPERRREGLEALRGAVEQHRAGTVAGLALFALSPVPSAQLFIAAGVTGVRLVPLVAAFFCGRTVSYAIYVGAATTAQDELGDLVGDALTSPASIALQLALLAGLVVLVRTDWVRVLRRRADGPPAPPCPPQADSSSSSVARPCANA